MDDKAKKELLRRISSGELDSHGIDDLISNESTNLDRSRGARDLAESTLGREYLRQTGVSIPNIKNASRKEMEAFLNKLKEEQYPELSDYSVESRDLDAMGYSVPDKKRLLIDPKKHKSIEDIAGTLFHESGHAYDDIKGTDSLSDSILNRDKQRELRKLQIIANETGISPDAYDLSKIYQKGHHANIPKLRPDDSFGFGALKGLVKNKGFKSVTGALPIVGSLLGAGMALDSGDATAAIPGLDMADSVGETPEQENQMLAETKARMDYDKSQARRDALSKLRKK